MQMHIIDANDFNSMKITPFLKCMCDNITINSIMNVIKNSIQ